MLKDVSPGDFIRSIRTLKVHKVKAVDNYYGWFSIFVPKSKPRILRMGATGNAQFVKLTKEQVADYFLLQETLGLTDHWREDD